MIRPSDTVPTSMGGTYAGAVTWLDSMWVSQNLLGAQLWGFASSSAMPLLCGLLANHSQFAGALPPMQNVYAALLAEKSNGKDTIPLEDDFGKWARGFLTSIVEYASKREPYVGRTMPQNAGGKFSHLQTLLDAYTAASSFAAGGGTPAMTAAGSSNASLPFTLPYQSLSAAPTTPRPRIIYSAADVPRADSFTDAGAPLRVCVKRGVLVGDKPFMVGGVAEANLVRDFAYRQVKVPVPDWKALGPNPPQTALIVDRGLDEKKGSVKPRGFVNPEAMMRVLEKYGVKYRYVTDKDLSGMTFAQQAALFGSHGLLIMAHGAGESNALFMPARSAIIEISPYGMWCPLYTRMASYLGFHVLPIYSRLKGPNLDYLFQSSWTEDWRQRAARIASDCDAMDLPKAARGNCFSEYRRGSVNVPIHEFEHVLLKALDLIGNRQFPRNAALALLDGEAQAGVGPTWYAPGLYENASAVVCPPRAACALDGGSGAIVAPLAGGRQQDSHK